MVTDSNRQRQAVPQYLQDCNRLLKALYQGPESLQPNSLTDGRHADQGRRKGRGDGHKLTGKTDAKSLTQRPASMPVVLLRRQEPICPFLWFRIGLNPKGISNDLICSRP
ncbi:hypothetical protein GJAV_G00254700 [Gymnothorax javanicus]|nr:hypothetical protein GJAV_G00254700 [Gymnothorax javanicus]